MIPLLNRYTLLVCLLSFCFIHAFWEIDESCRSKSLIISGMLPTSLAITGNTKQKISRIVFGDCQQV